MMEQERPAPRHPSRREFLSLGIGAFVFAALPGALRGPVPLTRRSLPVMGTVAELAVAHRDARHAHAAIGAALAELRRVEALMTRFSPHSEVGRANLRAAREPVPVRAETAAVLAAALHWAAASGGAFDPTLGRAVELWDVARRQAPPPEAEVRRFAGRRLFQALELEPHDEGARIRFHAPDLALDLGGIAKGYGVDRAAQVLREWGVADALVNVGGDIVALGASADGDPWEIGIRSPSDPQRLSGVLRLADRAVATSGDYEQFFTHAGRRYHHLLDPRTGEPHRSAAQTVTVTAASCLAADAAATACFGSGRSESERVLAAAAPDAQLVHLA